MGTRGHISVVSSEHHYSLYQHWDMYPSGWPTDLFKEAAEVARNDQWEVVAHGWANKAWIDWPDNELPQKLRESVTHPDGRQVEWGGWSHGMRPRLSVDQMEAKARRRGASESLIAGLLKEVEAAPSFVEAAVIGAMEKDLTLTGGGHDREFGVVVDMDCGEIVMLKYCGPWMGERYPVPIARAALDDPEAMLDVAEWANGDKGERFDSVEIPESIRANAHIRTWGPRGDGESEGVCRHDDERLEFPSLCWRGPCGHRCGRWRHMRLALKHSWTPSLASMPCRGPRAPRRVASGAMPTVSFKTVCGAAPRDSRRLRALRSASWHARAAGFHRRGRGLCHQACRETVLVVWAYKGFAAGRSACAPLTPTSTTDTRSAAARLSVGECLGPLVLCGPL